MFDMLIRNGTVVDGTGASPAVKDVAIKDGKIVALGEGIGGAAKEVLDATGLLVAPGFIDIHTHYDAQVLWDTELQPSVSNGVTTFVMGNCGVGLAPVKKEDTDWLAYVLEVIEEVPSDAVKKAVDFNFESFPEYLDEIDKRSYTMDIIAQVPHVAVRAYVMGERGIRNEPATAEDLAAMRKIVQEAVEAGAFGFSTSRCMIHMLDSGPLPGTYAKDDEMLAMAEAIRDAGGGVVQMIPSGQGGVVEGDGKETKLAGVRPDPHRISDEVRLMRQLHQKTGVACTFSFSSNPSIGDDFARVMSEIDAAHAEGEPILPQIPGRFLTVLSNLDTQHIFVARPTYHAIAHLPVADRARKMAEPEVKAAILSEQDVDLGVTDPLQMMAQSMRMSMQNIFPYEGKATDYDPLPEQSVTARAASRGCSPDEVVYDLLIEDEGKAILIWIFDYSEEVMALRERQLHNPGIAIGAGDAGAHAKLIVDAGIYTHLLSRWAKDRRGGKAVPVEMLVHRSTKLVADTYGLDDRGVIAVGKRADLNVIDHDRLGCERPRLVADFPGGSKRYLQDGIGYVMTMVNGVPVRRNDQSTGARPGKVLRNPRARAARGTEA
ncbi:MAG: N-acyl-D-amino-acid deacylase family protein [Chakrabartia sp.]